jgi:hypothetical protein
MTDQPVPPRAAQGARNPLDKEITGAHFALVDLFRANAAAGGGAILEGRTFRDCRIEGPALMLVLENVHFDRVNFGPTGGNMRNMLFQPMGDMGIGSIAVRNCTFINCEFLALGITGNESLLKMLIDQVPVGDAVPG